MLKDLIEELSESPMSAIIAKDTEGNIEIIPVKKILYITYYESKNEIRVGVGPRIYTEFRDEEAEDVIEQLIKMGAQ